MVVICNSRGMERFRLALVRIIFVDCDRVELPFVLSLDPARSESPLRTFVMTVFEHFVIGIVIVICMVEIEIELSFSIDHNLTTYYGFIRRLTRRA